MNAAERVIQSREIASEHISAAQSRAESAFGPAQVTATTATAAAIMFLADVILLCFEPTLTTMVQESELIPRPGAGS